MGKTAVLGDGLQYQPIVMSNIDAQLVEQLRMTAETVCSAFHVPAHMVGVGAAPTYNNIEALNQEYYSQCLQAHIESIELLLDEGLELPKPYGTEFDLDGLLRMDTHDEGRRRPRTRCQSGVVAQRGAQRDTSISVPPQAARARICRSSNCRLAASCEARPKLALR